MLKVIERVDRILKLEEYKILMQKLSETDDEKKFNKTLDNMNNKEKSNFEEAVIGLTYYKEIISKEMFPEEEKFLIKYNNYCINKAKRDIKTYLNNRYLKYLYTSKLPEYASNEDKIVAINDINISDLIDSLNNEYNNLIKKLDEKELNNNEKIFIINFFNVCSDYFTITNNKNNNIMYDVVKFFDKYPIKNLKVLENKKNYILYTLSKELSKYNYNSIIKFKEFDAKNIRELAYFKKVNENTGMININRMNPIHLETDEEFIRTLFSLYHELGHFEQEFKISKYTDFEREIMNMELEIIKMNRNFYSKYHDNFFSEQDADLYATKLLLKNFHHKNLKSILLNILSSRNMINQNQFMKLFFEEYYYLHKNKDQPQDAKNNRKNYNSN